MSEMNRAELLDLIDDLEYWIENPPTSNSDRDAVRRLQVDAIACLRAFTGQTPAPTFHPGQLVKKCGTKGQWHGRICGSYSTDITPEGYAVESLLERGSVQIYPASALEPWDGESE